MSMCGVCVLAAMTSRIGLVALLMQRHCSSRQQSYHHLARVNILQKCLQHEQVSCRSDGSSSNVSH